MVGGKFAMSSINTITSLAILKVNWDKDKKDYIENYVPFIVHLINKIGYTHIDVNQIRKDFENLYGISLPYHPTITILNRARERGYIEKKPDRFEAVKERIVEDDFMDVSNEQTRKINNVIHHFVEYSNKQYDVTMNASEAEGTLISFLRDHDLEIIFASHEDSVLPFYQVSKSNKYIFSKFVKHAYSTNEKLFNSIVDISIGHILANTILYDEFNSYLGELEGNKYYLDVPILLELIGASGQERKEIYEEFINTLIETGIELFVFQHTYEELIHNLENCIRWLNNPLYDPEKASTSLNFFVVNDFTPSDVEQFIAKIPNTFNTYGIEVVGKPEYIPNVDYQISEKDLKGRIIDLYKKSNPEFDEYEKDLMIQNDVDSISAIYRLRKGNLPTNLEEAEHIFITKNSTLAYVTSQYEKENNYQFTINPCLTDTFIGTLIWLQTPARIYEINKKKLIADVYAALQPDGKLIKRYLNEIKEMLEKEEISIEEFYLLRSHNVSMNLLEEKTLGDPEKFTDKTPKEILEDLKNKYKIEGEEKYKIEKNEHDKTKTKLVTIKDDYSSLNKNVSNFINNVASAISWGFFNIVIVLIGLLVAKSVFNFKFSNGFDIGLAILLAVITLFNIGFGLNIFKFKKLIYNKVKSTLSDRLLKNA